METVNCAFNSIHPWLYTCNFLCVHGWIDMYIMVCNFSVVWMHSGCLILLYPVGVEYDTILFEYDMLHSSTYTWHPYVLQLSYSIRQSHTYNIIRWAHSIHPHTNVYIRLVFGYVHHHLLLVLFHVQCTPTSPCIHRAYNVNLFAPKGPNIFHITC